MKKILLLAIVCVTLFSCNKGGSGIDSDSLKNAANAQKEEYTVLNKDESTIRLGDNSELKSVTFTVELDGEYPKEKVDEIADELKDKDLEYAFFDFFVKGQDTSDNPYAVVTRTPEENSTVVNGVTKSDPYANKVRAPYARCKVYGAWKMSGTTVVAYQKGGKCYMVDNYGNGKYGEPIAYKLTTFQDMTAFQNLSDAKDMYVINEDGDLDGYNGDDFATTYKQTDY